MGCKSVIEDPSADNIGHYIGYMSHSVRLMHILYDSNPSLRPFDFQIIIVTPYWIKRLCESKGNPGKDRPTEAQLPNSSPRRKKAKKSAVAHISSSVLTLPGLRSTCPIATPFLPLCHSILHWTIVRLVPRAPFGESHSIRIAFGRNTAWICTSTCFTLEQRNKRPFLTSSTIATSTLPATRPEFHGMDRTSRSTIRALMSWTGTAAFASESRAEWCPKDAP